jgi:type IV secretion system protein VirD4
VLSGGPGSTEDSTERAAGIALIVIAGFAGLVIATGYMSALLFNGGWPGIPAHELPGIVGRTIVEPFEPDVHWNRVNDGTLVPGPLAWWFTFLLLLTIGVGIAFLVVRSLTSETAGSGIAAAPTRTKDVRKLALDRDAEDEVVVGTVGGHEMAVKDRRSLLVLGPVRSGKTSALTIPALLEWPGPVVVTATGSEVLDHTIGRRSHLGDVHVFDPARATRHRASGWSPLATSSTWLGAQQTAWDMSMAGKATVSPASGLGEFWFGSAARSLAPYLFAASESGRTMADVARWVDTEERDDVLAILRPVEPDAAVAHAATFRREGSARTSLFGVMRALVGPYLDPTVAASALRPEIEVAELLDGGPHTLYLIAPHHGQDRVRTLHATLVRQMLNAVHQRVDHSHRPLDPHLLLLLDDAADIAPVEDLATVATTSPAAGIQLVTVYRDLPQIETTHGADAVAVLTNHRAKLVFPGSAGVDAMALAALLRGEEPEGDNATGLPPELARQLPEDEALLLVDERDPLRVHLRPWYKDRELRRRAGAAQDALSPSEVDLGSLSPFEEVPSGPGPVTNPVPDPPPFDPTFPPDAQPHFPSNVSALDAARARLRRPRSPSHDDA